MNRKITILESSVSFESKPGETILDAALRQYVSLPHDCTFGSCGTCTIRLVSGEVDYEEPPCALSPKQSRLGYALACQARPRSDSVISISLEQDGAAQKYSATVEDICWLTHDVARLRLKVESLAPVVFRPGQYMNVHIAGGAHRSFSMASPPQTMCVELFVGRVQGGLFTDMQLRALKPGDLLDVEMPLGRFQLHPEDYRPILMVATGTGIAPIKCMLDSLMGDDNCPPVSLYWGVRTEADLFLQDKARLWQQHVFEFEYCPVLSRGAADWTGRRGYVQDCVLADFNDLSEHSIYICGSPAMVSQSRQAFIARGANPDHMYVDSFEFQHERLGHLQEEPPGC